MSDWETTSYAECMQKNTSSFPYSQIVIRKVDTGFSC